ncbi:glucose dehydrogenase [FAD, quinone]-like [Centruroides vittatus]|uniref:glucose dehydrogenase [FAD, quinone]-like n=1 Tax=Centruroides vittatus TaxID=120091 RepID=UPI00350FCCEE
MPPQGTLFKGRRWTTFHGYIEPIRGRRNIRIITLAYVTKILINENKRAYGVIFEIKGRGFKAIAKQEVILSAGAFNSPKLLLLSGIGRKEVLIKFNIPIIADLPVGENLINHLSTGGLHFSVNSYTFNENRITKENYVQFSVNGTGPLSSLGGIETLGFVNSKYNKNLNWPDIEIYWTSKSLASDSLWRANSGITDELAKIFEKFRSLDTVICSPFPTRPKSKGTVTIESTDPYAAPVIDFNYYSDQYDIKIMVEGMKFCLNLTSTKAMKKFDAKPLPYTMPGCEKHKKFSDKYLECMAKAFPFALHHFAGTCKMGAFHDPTTVVDPALRVKGIDGLRVVDASVIPTQIGGHINIPIIMIAEKAADMILESYQNREYDYYNNRFFRNPYRSNYFK